MRFVLGVHSDTVRHHECRFLSAFMNHDSTNSGVVATGYKEPLCSPGCSTTTVPVCRGYCIVIIMFTASYWVHWIKVSFPEYVSLHLGICTAGAFICKPHLLFQVSTLMCDHTYFNCNDLPAMSAYLHGKG